MLSESFEFKEEKERSSIRHFPISGIQPNTKKLIVTWCRYLYIWHLIYGPFLFGLLFPSGLLPDLLADIGGSGGLLSPLESNKKMMFLVWSIPFA